jgi:FkbM family methyltransferase
VIVVDVGCADYGRYDSIRYLERHAFNGVAPHVIYGCDPSPSMDELKERYRDDPLVVTKVMLKKEAAWTYDGEISFVDMELGSHVSEEEVGEKVPCFDLAAFLRSLPSDEEIVLKIDAEGAEYPLLEHLIATRTDELLKAAWVEWHPLPNHSERRRRRIESKLSCELWEWGL